MTSFEIDLFRKALIFDKEGYFAGIAGNYAKIDKENINLLPNF
jgi:hypothetical protein